MKSSIATRLLIAAAMLFAAASCTTKENTLPKTLEYYTGNAQQIQGEKLPAEYLVSSSFGCFYTPQGFIGEMELPNKKLIHLADAQTGEVLLSAVTKGRGPNEMLIGPSVQRMDLYGNNLYANDVMGGKVLKISIAPDTLAVQECFNHQFNKSDFALNLRAVSDSLFAFFLGTRTGGRLALTDNTGKVLDTLYYPIVDDPLLAKDVPANFNVSMALTPCRNWLYVQNHTFNNIRKYRIADNRITLEKTYNLTEPRYTIVNGKVKLEDDNAFMNSRISIGEKYIYMRSVPEIYKDYKERLKKEESNGQRGYGEPQTNTHILVFDHDFNLVKSYVSDILFSSIILTPDPATIYVDDSNGHCLRKFTLPGLK